MKFPMSEDFGGFSPEYLSALDAYMKQSDLRQAELHGMFRKTIKSDTLPEWPDMFNVSGPLPVPEDLEPIINNLVGVVLEHDKKIVDTAKGFVNGEWFFAVRVE